MRTTRQRWAVVAAVTAGLVSLPVVASALPAPDSDVPADVLLDRVRASASVPFSGYGESRGTLALPDARELGELPALFGGTTRTRVWWRAPDRYRVDALSPVGEDGTVVDPTGSWDWSSADRRGVRVRGRLDLRLPGPADLVAPVLARRLAGADDVEATRLPARRVAGRSAPGVRLVPRSPDTTTVERVDLWADEATGLPLRVEVVADGVEQPVLSALLLDLDLTAPGEERTRFRAAPGDELVSSEAPDIAALADRLSPYRLPDELAGLRRSTRVDELADDGTGVGTYGTGLTALAVVPLPEDLARRLVDRVAPEAGSRTAAISTPLVSGLLVRTAGDRSYLLAGTVPPELLERAAQELRADPPPRVRR